MKMRLAATYWNRCGFRIRIASNLTWAYGRVATNLAIESQQDFKPTGIKISTDLIFCIIKALLLTIILLFIKALLFIIALLFVMALLFIRPLLFQQMGSSPATSARLETGPRWTARTRCLRPRCPSPRTAWCPKRTTSETFRQTSASRWSETPVSVGVAGSNPCPGSCREKLPGNFFRLSLNEAFNWSMFSTKLHRWQKLLQKICCSGLFNKNYHCADLVLF